MDSDFSIIIPAAGMGRRMKSFGPKSLIRLHNTTVIEKQLTLLQETYPKNDIVIVTGFEDVKVERYVEDWKGKVVGSKIKVVKNNHFQTTNVAKSICLGTEYCDKENYLIVYGDLVFNRETITGFRPTGSSVLLSKNGDFNREEIGAAVSGNQVTGFFYESKTKWSQIAYLKKDEMQAFVDIMDDPRVEKWFTFEVFNKMLEAQIHLAPYFNSHSKIVELDHSKDVFKAREMVSKGEI